MSDYYKYLKYKKKYFNLKSGSKNEGKSGSKNEENNDTIHVEVKDMADDSVFNGNLEPSTTIKELKKKVEKNIGHPWFHQNLHLALDDQKEGQNSEKLRQFSRVYYTADGTLQFYLYQTNENTASLYDSAALEILPSIRGSTKFKKNLVKVEVVDHTRRIILQKTLGKSRPLSYIQYLLVRDNFQHKPWYVYQQPLNLLNVNFITKEHNLHCNCLPESLATPVPIYNRNLTLGEMLNFVTSPEIPFGQSRITFFLDRPNEELIQNQRAASVEQLNHSRPYNDRLRNIMRPS